MTLDAVADMTYDEARDAVDAIRRDVDALIERVGELFSRRAWIALGYPSWRDMCAVEFPHRQLPCADRVKVVSELRAEGMSTRAIGDAIGVDHSVVVRDAPLVQNPPVAVTGIDGRTYTPSKTRAAIADRVAKAKELAATGHSSRQIAAAIGISPNSMAVWRRRHGVEVPADKIAGYYIPLDAVRVVTATIQAVDGIGLYFGDIDYATLPADDLDGWVCILTEAIRSLDVLRKNLTKQKGQTQP